MVIRTGFASQRKCVALLLVTILACTSPPSGGISTPAPRVDRVHVESQYGDYEMISTAEGSELRASLQSSAATVWGAVPRAYAALEIPLEGIDTGHRFLVGVVFVRRAFANKPLSYYVNCGSTLVGPNANTYNVRLHLQTQVDSVGPSASSVRTILNATGASDGGITVRCSSTGDVERLIVARVKELLAQ